MASFSGKIIIQIIKSLLGNHLLPGCPIFECPGECIYAKTGYEKSVSSLGEHTSAPNEDMVTPEEVLRNIVWFQKISIPTTEDH